jgi:hypothetical protein
MMLRCALALTLLAFSAQAPAQLRLPGGGSLGPLPGAPTIGSPLNAAPRLPDLAGTDAPLQPLRQRVVQGLLREQAARVEADPAGEPVLRGELLAVQPSDAWLARATAQGFRVLREQRLQALALRSVVLAPPTGLSTREGLERLRAIEPPTEVDFQHLYTRSGELAAGRAAPSTPGGALAAAARRVGLIDDGVDRAHPALRAASIVASGCEAAAAPGMHGTAIASLLVGRDGAFAGLLPREATLYAADVYCGQAVGGSVEAVVQALGWMAQERVAVVNVSLVGPPNRLLEQALRAMAARGHLVVAAVGNDGPAAPPLYPAAYPEVVGVTAVAPTRRALPEAARGAHVAFAAPGSELAVAQAGSADYAVARGTSFAAPFVAGMLADALVDPDPAAARQALERLALQATDLGSPGRDPVFGWGLVAEQARNAPSRVQAMRRSRP